MMSGTDIERDRQTQREREREVEDVETTFWCLSNNQMMTRLRSGKTETILPFIHPSHHVPFRPSIHPSVHPSVL